MAIHRWNEKTGKLVKDKTPTLKSVEPPDLPNTPASYIHTAPSKLKRRNRAAMTSTLTVNQAAKYMQMESNEVISLLDTGELKYERKGKIRHVTWESILKYLEEKRGNRPTRP